MRSMRNKNKKNKVRGQKHILLPIVPKNLNMKYLIATLSVAIAVILATIADVYLKKSQLSNYKYILVGIVLYALGALPVAVAFKTVDFSLVFFIWEALAIILGLGLGIIIFKEHFSALKVGAFVAALVSLALCYFASKV